METKFPLTDKWIKKMCAYIYMYACVCVYIYIYIYKAIKKKKILPFATTWMDLEGIMLSEISWAEKDKYCMISLTCEI